MSRFIDSYFKRTAPYALKREYPVIAGLHLNEMPRDIPAELKDRLVDRFRRLPLNRYPEPFADSLAAKLAGWYGCAPNQVLIGPGSSAFIRLLLTYFGLHMRGRLVITRPSFAYYEQFCLAFGIDYDTWELDDDYQYVPSRLDDLPDYSVVFLTTPNNPTGSLIDPSYLPLLLARHPSCLFVVDEAYAEFTSQNLLPLLGRHDNLLLLRTFSKAFSAAALRCGALIGNPELIEAVGGLQTPWQLSPYSIEGAKVMIDYQIETNYIESRVREIISERTLLERRCRERAGTMFTIYPSYANFLLFRGKTAKAHATLLAACASNHIRIEDSSLKPRLAYCLRVTIGSPEENRLFSNAFEQAMRALVRPTAPR